MCFPESKTRSGRGYSPWDTATVIKVDIDATSLLQRAVESERTRQYDEDASPEFSPALTPTRTSNGVTVVENTASTLSEVSQRLTSFAHSPPPITHNNPVIENLTRKARKILNKRAKEKKKMMTTGLVDVLKGRKIRQGTANNYASPRIINVNFVVAALTMARYADVGKNRPAGPSVPTLEDIRRDHPDFTLITNPELQPIVLLDKNGVLLSGIVPGPGDSDSEKVSWDGGMLDLADFIEDLREGEQVRWLGGEQDHRRGKYPFVSWGSVHGNGRLGPGLLKVRHPAVAYSLRNHNMVKRVAGHQDAVFQFYAPKMYDYCRERVASLLDHHDDLDRPFTNSIYTTFTVNMGPSSACTEHVDNLNSAEVMCGVTSAGRYDHTKGGHLVLYDLKVIIEFPSGWTAFLPSATLRHGNTAIQAGETRYAITQYIPGGLFRWVRHGFRLAKDLSEVERLAMEGTSDDRLRMAYGLFSKFDELVKDRNPFT